MLKERKEKKNEREKIIGMSGNIHNLSSCKDYAIVDRMANQISGKKTESLVIVIWLTFLSINFLLHRSR